MLAQLPPRALYGSEFLAEMELCRKSGRGISIPLSQPSRLDSQYDSPESTLSRGSPPADSDAKNGGQARRRIAVACERCRKRKIKCSGDPGDGRGCNNCRNSGNHRCQFLRVQSTVVETRQHIPYQVNSRHSLFPHSMSRASPYAVGPYQAGANQYGHVTSGFDSYGQPPSQAFNRPQYPFTSEDEAQTYYNIQAASSPAFMLPSSMNYYNAPAAQKAWSFSQGTRTPQSSLYSDTSSTNAISSSGPSFISNPSANDVSGTFPSVSSVISASTPTRDRTLPDPASTRNINGTISAAAESSADHVSLNSATYRPSGIWGSTDCFSADNRYRDISHSDSVSDTQDLNFGFSVPVSSSSGRIAQSSDQGHNIGSPSAFRANLSAGSELSPDSSAADNYSYGTESSPRRGSIGHLSNGDTYTRIPPNERLVNSYGVIHRPENQEFSGSRTGIASMSTEGSY